MMHRIFLASLLLALTCALPTELLSPKRNKARAAPLEEPAAAEQSEEDPDCAGTKDKWACGLEKKWHEKRKAKEEATRMPGAVKWPDNDYKYGDQQLRKNQQQQQGSTKGKSGNKAGKDQTRDVWGDEGEGASEAAEATGEEGEGLPTSSKEEGEGATAAEKGASGKRQKSGGGGGGDPSKLVKPSTIARWKWRDMSDEEKKAAIDNA